MRIALATCLVLPEVDRDAPLLDAALRARGAEPSLLAWDDPEAWRAREHELVVLRSTWNYYRDLPAFLAWVDATSRGVRVVNPPHVVRGNVEKSYLLDLEGRGVPIVPTAVVRRGERPSLARMAAVRQWQGGVVVKPLVSAGSFRTERFEPEVFDAGDAHLHALTAERDVLVQPWMPAVTTTGERALVWIDGELTHAVRKEPRFATGHEAVSSTPVPVADDERAFAGRVLEASRVQGDLLYARIDVIRDRDGALCLMELELIEPSLFLAQHPPALDRFADAIVTRARRA